MHYFDSQRVRDPQKPKIDPVDPPVDPILAQFVGKKADFGVKNRVFLKKIYSKSFFIGSQMVWDPQNPKIDLVEPPVDTILTQFVRKKADFGVKKNAFFSQNFFAPNHFLSVPRWSGILKN